jgi:hypothetical protein
MQACDQHPSQRRTERQLFAIDDWTRQLQHALQSLLYAYESAEPKMFS